MKFFDNLYLGFFINLTTFFARFFPMNSTAVTAALPQTNFERFCQLVIKARESLAKAIEADETRTSKRGVITLYKAAIRDLTTALGIRPSRCPDNKFMEIQERRANLEKHLLLAQERVITLENNQSQTNVPGPSCFRPLTSSVSGSNSTGTSNIYNAKKNTESLLKGVKQSYGEEILSTIVEKTGVKLSSIEGNEKAKRALEESVIFPALNPSLFTGLRAPCKGILLYGPPGNGKTMLAKAAAEESKYTFFNISASIIMSKWVGDGEKMVKALFQVARNAQPSIIFIDEVDSILCDRSENENGAARRVKTEFLLQFDGCSSSLEEKVLVLAATNRPQELDDGVLRRFPQKIFIDLPDAKTRIILLAKTFKNHNTTVNLSQQEWDLIGQKTENYSFSDILAVCRAAAMNTIQSVGRNDLARISAKNLRPVNKEDLLAAIDSIRPSTNAEKRKKLIEFAGFKN